MSSFKCGDSERLNAGVQKIKEICDFDEQLALSNCVDDNIEKIDKLFDIRERILARIRAEEQQYNQVN